MAKKKTKRKPKGLGDVVETVLEKTGVDKVAKFVLGEDCGCDERKEKLNKLFPFNKTECLNEDEYKWLTDFFALNTNRMTVRQQTDFIAIYNRVFNRKTTLSNCGQCVAEKIRQIKRVYNEYD